MRRGLRSGGWKIVPWWVVTSAVVLPVVGAVFLASAAGTPSFLRTETRAPSPACTFAIGADVDERKTGVDFIITRAAADADLRLQRLWYDILGPAPAHEILSDGTFAKAANASPERGVSYERVSPDSLVLTVGDVLHVRDVHATNLVVRNTAGVVVGGTVACA